MKYEEALEIIKDELPFTSVVIEEALGVVEKCVNKQISKKVVFGYDEQDPITCPDCKTELAYMDGYGFESRCYKYCPNCGRKLDWSDTK